MAADRSHAAILCSHGHGPFGKDPVAGVRSSAQHVAQIEQHNYNYGEQMARAGYLTLSPDLRAFGERRDGWSQGMPGEAYCNSTFVRGALLGIYPLALNVFDMMRCVDYMQTRPEVDPERIGMMGLSQGGTMTTFAIAAEPRIAAADIMGYVNPWAGFGIARANFCGSQVLPDIYRYLDTHDIAGLMAPRPLLLEMGIYDNCFYIQDLLKGYAGVKRIYDAAGVGERLWADTFPGPHAFGGRKTEEFFARYL
jgi:dienelactone hydrolase